MEETLDRFSKRQFTITESCDNWSKIMTEKREIEILWERTMSENVQVSVGVVIQDKCLLIALSLILQLTDTEHHIQDRSRSLSDPDMSHGGTQCSERVCAKPFSASDKNYRGR